MIPFLFPEITDLIIDYLHPDKPSLFACGLTCRTWLASSRHHLFSKVRLGLYNIQSFSELLDNPSNNVAAVVRHLTVASFEWVGYGPDSEQHGAEVVLQRLPSLTAHLRMVKFLKLSRMSWTACSPEILQRTLSNLGTVEVLELNSVTVRGLDEAVEVICAFPLLKSLSVDLFVWTDHRFDNPPQSIAAHRQRLPFAIHTINIEHPPAPSLMWWLLRHMSSVHTIRCYSVVQDDNPYLQATLTSLGPSIQEIRVCTNVIFNDTLPIINIIRCTSLRSIHFHSIWLSSDSVYMDQFFILPILDQVSSSSFEELTLHIVRAGTRWTAYLDWEGIAERLSQPKFANLKRVYVKWPKTPRVKPSDVKSFFEKGPFSSLTRRGLVQVKMILEDTLEII